MLAGLAASPAFARSKQPRICSNTAQLQFSACFAELNDDYLTSKAKCLNVVDEDARDECFDDAKQERGETFSLCRDQKEAREAFCEEIGEGAYAPDMSPSLFQDPRDPATPNPYFPLAVGDFWVFEEEEERIEIRVLDETKRVDGIDCIVVNDRVFVDEKVVEDTDDWFGIRTDGSIEYCGEAVQDFEIFPGDDPEEEQLVSIEGSFKAGLDGAKSGTAFLGAPVVGQSYRQEWDAGNAEDTGKVLSVAYAHGQSATLDEFVPEALAMLMCAQADCVVIQDGSTLDPDAFERKYYARGVGKFLEVKPEEGIAIPLIECNTDPRCSSLPVD
ncbi:MAG: hypothetical protein R3F21_07595 [Myxococcota bacterium]